MTIKKILIGLAWTWPLLMGQVHADIHLDQSKNIFLDQLDQTQLALQILQNKNVYKRQDLIVGGSLQTDLQHWIGDKIETSPAGIYHHGNAIYLTQANLDLLGMMNEWFTGYLSLTDAHIWQSAPDGNDIYFQNMFLLWGNIEKNPLYLLFGINTIPFGVFTGSGVWDSPLTSEYFNPSTGSQLSLGFFKNGLNLQATAYTNSASHDNNFAYNISYHKDFTKFNFTISAGYLTDLKTNATGNRTTYRVRKRKFPLGFDLGSVVDLNGNVGYGLWQWYAEYDVGTKSVGLNKGKPAASSITLNYTPKIAGKDTTFGISVSRSYQLKNIPAALAGANNIPLANVGLKSIWAASASRSFFVDSFTAGLNIEKTKTYSNKSSLTFTLESFLYL